MIYNHNRGALQQVGNLLIAWRMWWKVALIQRLCEKMKMSVAQQDFGGSVWSNETAVRSGVVHAKGK